MAAEITDQGPLVETQDQVVDGLNTSFVGEFGNAIDVSPDGYTGREIPIVARSIVQLQNLTAETVTALNLDSTQGRFLDNLGVLLDEGRKGATRSTISAQLTGAAGLDVGDKRVRYKRNDTLWRTPAGAELAANGQLSVALTAVDTGGVEAFQDSTAQWVIVDEVVGWIAVESTSDASLGTPVEGDPEYKPRLKLAGRSSGVGTEPGDQRALLGVPAVRSVRLLNNRTLNVNADGVPGKSIEAVVDGGDPQTIFQVMLDTYGGTDGFAGTLQGTATDVLGNPRTVRFTPVARIDLELRVTIDTTGAEAPLPDDALSTAVNVVDARVNGLGEGINVSPDDIAGQVRAAFEGGTIPQGQVAVEIGLKGGTTLPVTYVIGVRESARTFAGVQAGQVIGTTTQTFVFVVSWELALSSDGGNVQVVTFLVSDFVNTGAATTLEIATVINRQTTGITAGSIQGALTIASDTLGAASSINVTSATTVDLLTELGLVIGSTSGSDGDISVTIV